MKFVLFALILFVLISMPARALELLDNLSSGQSTQLPLQFDLVPAPTSAPTTDPDAPQHSLNSAQRMLSEFIGHFSGYQPMYFVAGPGEPLAKFEYSFKYQLLNSDAPLAKKIPPLGDLYFAYSQISLWEIDKPSAPFLDTSYMPEFFFSDEDIRQVKIPLISQLGLQSGYAHESNGKAGPDSRGVNMFFIRPIATFGDPENFHFYFAPRFFVYLGELDGNPDIARYRGYCQIRAAIGWRQGLELAAMGYVGKNFNKGSLQLDLTYPLRDILDQNFDVYLDAQYFNGYGETLLLYNQRSQIFRIGLALVR